MRWMDKKWQMLKCCVQWTKTFLNGPRIYLFCIFSLKLDRDRMTRPILRWLTDWRMIMCIYSICHDLHISISLASSSSSSTHQQTIFKDVKCNCIILWPLLLYPPQSSTSIHQLDSCVVLALFLKDQTRKNRNQTTASILLFAKR